jgi:hypothetical protein
VGAMAVTSGMWCVWRSLPTSHAWRSPPLSHRSSPACVALPALAMLLNAMSVLAHSSYRIHDNPLQQPRQHSTTTAAAVE